MNAIVEFLANTYHSAYASMGDGLIVMLCLIAFIGIVAQWRLYEKAGQPGIASLVPVWNFVIFLRIVGRPASHMFLFLIPVYGQLYMIPKVYIELCNSFGKTSLLDYILVLMFNGFYILNLALSYETTYIGPVYGTEKMHAQSAAQIA